MNYSISELHRAEQQRFLVRNYLAHVLDGGMFMGGLMFINADTVLPVLLQSLGAPAWVISFAPSLMMIGLIVPSLFMVHFIEGIERMKPLILVTGIFQRLPFLFAGLALLFLADSHPVLTLIAVAAAPLVSGLMGGVSLGAWMELISRIIPVGRLSSANALRYILMALMGGIAAFTIQKVLEQWPGPRGYGVLHLIAFGFIVLSYFFFAFIREPVPPHEKPGTRKGFRETMRSFPTIVVEDVRFRRFLLARVFGISVFILLPFLPIHVLEVTGRESDFIGALVLAQMAGAFAGNVVAGRLGDQIGGRMPLMISSGVLLFACLAVFTNASAVGFQVIYFLVGFAVFAANVAAMTLIVEISPTEKRRTYLSITTACTLPAFLISGGLAAWIQQISGSLAPAAIICSLCSALALWLLMKVEVSR